VLKKSTSELAAIRIYPRTINGLNFPNLPFVLSRIYPITGSVIPSNTLIPVRINDITTTPIPAMPLA